MKKPVSSGKAVEALCPKCGLCCNGVIFADVKLRPAERPLVAKALQAMAALALPLAVSQASCPSGQVSNAPPTALDGPTSVLERKNSGPVKTVAVAGVAAPAPAAFAPARCSSLSQPCMAFDGRFCRIYADRPQHCRDFECTLLKRVISGQYPVEMAVSIIRRARKQAGVVRGLVRLLGDNDEALPLAARFGRVVKRLESSPPGPAVSRQFGKLTLEMHDLNQTLSLQFYPGAALRVGRA